MNTKHSGCVAYTLGAVRLSILLVLWASSIINAPAQSYRIDWFSVDGGAGTSTGGVYVLSGTIGQPDAGGPLTNAQYAITGGFWALPIAVQQPESPVLTITPAAAGLATVSWTPTAPGFVLQESLSLSPAAWVNAPSGGTNPISVPATAPAKYYRLARPSGAP